MNPLEDNIIVSTKKPRGRPRVPEDQKKKSDAAYHLAYYYRSQLSKDVKCELCNCTTTKQKLKRHQQSKKCKELTSYRIEVNEIEDDD